METKEITARQEVQGETNPEKELLEEFRDAISQMGTSHAQNKFFAKDVCELLLCLQTAQREKYKAVAIWTALQAKINSFRKPTDGEDSVTPLSVLARNLKGIYRIYMERQRMQREDQDAVVVVSKRKPRKQKLRKKQAEKNEEQPFQQETLNFRQATVEQLVVIVEEELKKKKEQEKIQSLQQDYAEKERQLKEKEKIIEEKFKIIHDKLTLGERTVKQLESVKTNGRDVFWAALAKAEKTFPLLMMSTPAHIADMAKATKLLEAQQLEKEKIEKQFMLRRSKENEQSVEEGAINENGQRSVAQLDSVLNALADEEKHLQTIEKTLDVLLAEQLRDEEKKFLEYRGLAKQQVDTLKGSVEAFSKNIEEGKASIATTRQNIENEKKNVSKTIDVLRSELEGKYSKIYKKIYDNTSGSIAVNEQLVTQWPDKLLRLFTWIPHFGNQIKISINESVKARVKEINGFKEKIDVLEKVNRATKGEEIPPQTSAVLSQEEKINSAVESLKASYSNLAKYEKNLQDDEGKLGNSKLTLDVWQQVMAASESTINNLQIKVESGVEHRSTMAACSA